MDTEIKYGSEQEIEKQSKRDDGKKTKEKKSKEGVIFPWLDRSNTVRQVVSEQIMSSTAIC